METRWVRVRNMGRGGGGGKCGKGPPPQKAHKK